MEFAFSRSDRADHPLAVGVAAAVLISVVGSLCDE